MAKFVELLARIILLRGFPRGSCHILLITPELKGRYQLAYSATSQQLFYSFSLSISFIPIYKFIHHVCAVRMSLTFTLTVL